MYSNKTVNYSIKALNSLDCPLPTTPALTLISALIPFIDTLWIITQKPNLHQLLLKMLPGPSWKKAGLSETHKDISESQTTNTAIE